MMLRRIRRFLGSAGLLLVLLLSQQPIVQAGRPETDWVDRAGGAEWGIDVNLTVTPGAPDEYILDLSATPRRDAPDLVLRWALPDGGLLQGGPASEAVGPTPAGEAVAGARTVRLPGPGVYALEGAAEYRPDAATYLTARGVLFLSWGEDGSVAVSDVDPRRPRYQPAPARPVIDKRAQVTAAGQAATNGCFDVQGTLTRNENLPSVSAGMGVYVLQGGPARPVHNVVVELREEDSLSDDSYGHTVTDDRGNFAFHFCDDDGLLDNELELYYRVCAEVREDDELVARVANSRDILYCFDSRRIESSGGVVDFDLEVFDYRSIEAAVFNIADALYYARRFWNDNAGASPRFDRPATAIWERGRRQTRSFYSQNLGKLIIADDESDPDEWDDSVIIHEWGHFADQQFSCNRNPGGRHALPGVNNGANGKRLAWGEGYPDYYQSAVRDIMPGADFTSSYIDPNGPTVDLETRPGSATDRNEGAIAALLWDFNDAASDGQDTVNHGHGLIQYVYTHPTFRNNAQCDMASFLKTWRDLGLATDAATAATVVQNVNLDITRVGAATVTAAEAVAADARASSALDYRWWDQVAMAVDTSSSMAGGGGAGKLGAVKQLIAEQVNDFTSVPHGTEVSLYTFDDGSADNQTLLEGRFFSLQILPAVNGLTADGADTGCYVSGLNALSQAVEQKRDAAAWLYTDGETAERFDAALFQRRLAERRIRASTVLLGGCGEPARAPTSISGPEESYLELGADASQSDGMSPYLLTALMSGGQFLYVAPDQLAEAADILRAQLDHTAGAGRWSDYVSDNATYRADRLRPDEYMVVNTDPSAGGTYYGKTENGVLDVFASGFERFKVYSTGKIVQTVVGGIGGPVWTTTYNVLQGNHPWYANLGSNEFPNWQECYGGCTLVYGKTVGDWFVLSSVGTGAPPPPGGDRGEVRYYQLFINRKTYEVRYEYGPLLNGDAKRSLIGIDNGEAPPLVVSEYSVNGAAYGTGYQFTPAPPQPTKTYAVNVDPLIESVIFLQTGYSGSFEPMIVQDPDGAPVDCRDSANVRCVSLNNGLVQFVQVNTGGKGGVYRAVIDAGATGAGTFSFNALAASPLAVESLTSHVLALKPIPLRIGLGRPVDGNVLQGWFQRPNGAAVGAKFTLYDDGAHGDDAAGDGIFGVETLTPVAAGVAYLWVEGTVGGAAVRRSDPIPFNIQPLEIVPSQAEAEATFGDATQLDFTITNQEESARCYAAAVDVPETWSVTLEEYFPCVEAGASRAFAVTVSRAADGDESGARGQVVLTLAEEEEGVVTGSAAVEVAFFRPVAAAIFDNRQEDAALRPNGTDTAALDILLLDDLGQISERSGAVLVELSTTLGSVATDAAGFVDGRLPVLFTAPDTPGDAEITALIDGELTIKTRIAVRAPGPAVLNLNASPTDLRAETASALTATVFDAWGDPVPGVTLRFSVSDDDGSQGTFNGAERIERVTDENGAAAAVFVKGTAPAGSVIVRVELEKEGDDTPLEASIALRLSDDVRAETQRLFLPFVVR